MFFEPRRAHPWRRSKCERKHALDPFAEAKYIFEQRVRAAIR
jgi:hypothetical protein